MKFLEYGLRNLGTYNSSEVCLVKYGQEICHLINYSWNLSNYEGVVEMTWNLVRISSEVCLVQIWSRN